MLAGKGKLVFGRKGSTNIKSEFSNDWQEKEIL